MENALRRMLHRRQKGIVCGIASYCTANDLVIEAILEQALRHDDDVLIEATANQVNQYGGYTGMTPADYRDYIYKIAEKVGFPTEKIILGGDHLGPLTWTDLPADEAMEKAKTLVRSFVLAGYKKIHLDTSMRLADDSTTERLSDVTIARRGADLYSECEDAYRELLVTDPSAEHPVFIIGSEVPIPGGAQSEEDTVEVTTPDAAEETIETYKRVFAERGLSSAFDYIIGIVVQPGVEFGDAEIHHYNRDKAKKLCSYMKKYPHLVMEGHSTDYQSPRHLKEMVEDGIAILKVGPALTFALRDALFSLSRIANEINPSNETASFIKDLDAAMVDAPGSWEKHYRGTSEEVALKRKYSFSDRCRYYLTQNQIQESIEKLFASIDGSMIPMGLLWQYMPAQYKKVRDGKIELTARSLVKDAVIGLIDDYNFATKFNDSADY